MLLGVLSAFVRQFVCEADHSPPSSAEVNVCGSVPTCPDDIILNYVQGQVYL
jgi:hypothetical protein